MTVTTGDVCVGCSLTSTFLFDTFDSRRLAQDSEVLILTCTLAPDIASGALHSQMQQPKRCCYFSSLSAGSHEAALWLKGFPSLSNGSGEELEINSLGAMRSLENALFGVKWVRLMSNEKQDVFVDVSRHREDAQRRATNDKHPINTVCLSYGVLPSYTCCMRISRVSGNCWKASRPLSKVAWIGNV